MDISINGRDKFEGKPAQTRYLFKKKMNLLHYRNLPFNCA